MFDESLQAELVDLAFAVCDGEATGQQIERIEQIVAEDAEARTFYLQCLELHFQMDRRAGKAESDEYGAMNDELPSRSGIAIDIHDAAPTHHSSFITDSLFSTHYPLSTAHSVFFSYLIATVVLGAAMAIAWAWKLPDYSQLVQQSEPRPSFVGRITGMADCQWKAESSVRGSERSEIRNPPVRRLQSPVSLGDRFALASGLLEISYDSGAKVILQGPCMYEVESPVSGYLSVGKLTARVESREWRVKSTNQQSPNSKSQTPNSSLSTTHDRLFTVTTPTATITDLGTEFGVEVGEEGQTSSHVFRGSVELRSVAVGGQTEPVARVLHENESACVKRGEDGDIQLTTIDASAASVKFVREIVRQSVKVLDLVDVVAGGDGFSGRREGNIDPSNGRLVRGKAEDFYGRDPKNVCFWGDGQYHRVEGQPLVDGVFIPNGNLGPVQVDSAGHRFGDFSTTSNAAGGAIHAGGVIPLLADGGVAGAIPTILGDVDYSSAGHGVLFLHSNKGITFDLQAIRNACPGERLLRFRATAGTSGDGVASLWALIDGRVRFRRNGINRFSGAFAVAIAIGENDRFLTLAATDGGDGIFNDWTMFGDPRLELVPAQPGERRSVKEPIAP